MTRKFAMAIAGGGSEAIGDLLRHGGMSGTFLGAVVMQATEATDSYLGGKPDHYVASETARALASSAFREAASIATEAEAFGVGATSALARCGEREGRRHRAFVCVQTRGATRVVSAELGPDNREAQESKVAELILEAVSYGNGHDLKASDILDPEGGDAFSIDEATAMPGWAGAVAGREPFTSYNPGPGSYVLASSFNPIHEAHIEMARWVGRNLGQGVVLELCVRNADKPPLDYISIRDRLAWITEATTAEMDVRGTAVTNAGLFVEKARLFPGCTFLVGADTLGRICDPAFASRPGGLPDDFREIAAAGCRLLAFPRPGHEMSHGRLPWRVACLTDFVTEDYTPSPLSSTELRQKESARA